MMAIFGLIVLDGPDLVVAEGKDHHGRKSITLFWSRTLLTFMALPVVITCWTVYASRCPAWSP